MREQMWCLQHGWHSDYSSGFECRCDPSESGVPCGLNVYDSESPRALVPFNAPWRYRQWRWHTALYAVLNMIVVPLLWGMNTGAIFVYFVITTIQAVFMIPGIMLLMDRFTVARQSS